MIKPLVRKLFPGVSWQNPVVNTVFKCIDPFDHVARLINGNTRLPPYSIRVRSAGINKQFGGSEFIAVGDQIAAFLEERASLSPTSRVLEIGCGSGRTAFTLGEKLENGNFYGMDIEEVALNSCLSNAYLQSKEFHFELMDVQNDEFNPNGKYSGSEFKFPYESGTFEVIYLVSVFTHMMTDDVKNYIAEISRLLSPGSTCMITTFLVDPSSEESVGQFPHKFDSSYCKEETMPEIAVAYEQTFYEREFEKHGVHIAKPALFGHWRNSATDKQPSSNILQDVIFFTKSTT